MYTYFIMKVELTNKRMKNFKDSHGVAVDFHINSQEKDIVIYQNVNVIIQTVSNSGSPSGEKYSFTEAWEYDPKKNTTDYFMVPLNWRERQKGYMKVVSYIWAISGKMPSHLKKGKDLDYWGDNAYGSFEKLTPKGKATSRTFKVSWDNIDKIGNRNYTKGKDLVVEWDSNK